MSYSEYYPILMGDVKCRYDEKIKIIDNIDPYTLGVETGDLSADLSILPCVSVINMVNYLVSTHSFFADQQLKAYKSLQAYKYYEAGFVQEVCARKINSNVFIVMGKMVRNYVRKTNRASIDEQQITDALKEVLQNKMSIRLAAIKYGIKKSTLHDRVKLKLKKSANDSAKENNDVNTIKRFSKYGCRQVFTVEHESNLMEYLKTSSNIQYGLTFTACRCLAYQYAAKLKLTYSPSWDINQMAGKDWMRQFMKRHKKLTYRKPENTSLARATAFNKSNVEQFFQNYIEVQKKFNFSPDRIINMDESGITTVLQAPKVIAPSGKKQVGQIVSQERGTLVTFCATITASGNTIPPFYIFPRMRMKDSYLIGSVTGSIAYGSKTGWMTSEIFIKYLEHLQKHSRCSKENPVLIIMDNHETHTTLSAVNYCRDNGIVLLSFPPHCTHRMQPLDIGVFGPFKGRLKTSFNDYMITNPGKTIKIDDIPKLSAQPYLLPFTPMNIINSFKKSGIWPINRLAFNEDDFAAAYVTDRPEPPLKLPLNNSDIQLENKAGPSTDNENSTITIISDISIKQNKSLVDNRKNYEIVLFSLNIILDTVFEIMSRESKVITPFTIRPLPKSAPRKGIKNSRLGKSRIFTSTPEKDRIEELEKQKLEKLEKKKEMVKRKLASKLGGKMKLKKTEKKSKERTSQIDTSSSDSASELPNKQFGSDSDMDMDIESDGSDDEILKLMDDENLNVGDYILVQFPNKKTVRYCVGQIMEIQDVMEYLVKFFRRRANKGFSFPDIDDISTINRQDIVSKLPRPLEVKGTSRVKSCIRFNVKLESYNIL